jgi:hypothetical protein
MKKAVFHNSFIRTSMMGWYANFHNWLDMLLSPDHQAKQNICIITFERSFVADINIGIQTHAPLSIDIA